MYPFFRSLLFFLPAETAHHFVFATIHWVCKIPGVGALIKKKYQVNKPHLRTTVFGLDFPNPVGLAAGFDKDAKLYKELGYFGFGFVEIGTLTPRPQPGNPKPRLFRLKKDQALINRMGFNNGGVAAAAQRLSKRDRNLIVGGNIGKNKDTPNEDAVNDYLKCYRTLYPFVDYFVVNVSSPNTPNLRALQDKEPLTALLQTLKNKNAEMPLPKPILLKIAPDLTNEQLDDIVEIVRTTGTDGIVATNTTIARENLQTTVAELQSIGAGGLSGLPVRQRSTEVIRYLHEKSEGAIPIIAVGGIFTAADAKEKMAAGASLVQIYTGFVYEGPATVRNILNAW
jgi:dihydroorotate dehydrogenase